MSSINSLGSSNSAWSAVSSQRSSRPPGGADAAAFKDKLFAKLDTDRSGGVDSSELQGLLDKLGAKAGTGATPTDPAATFKAMDCNGVGSLDKSELDAGLKTLLAQPSNTLAFAQSRGATCEQALFAKLDSNGRGDISAAERAAVKPKQNHAGHAASGDGTARADGLPPGGQQADGGDTKRFDALLKPLSSATQALGSGAAASSSAAPQPVDFNALASQVMRHDAQAQAGAGAAALGNVLSVAG